MDMDNTSGKTKAILKEISPMDSGQVMECGKKVLETRISMRVNTKMTRNGDMGFLLGRMVMFSRGVMKQI